METVAARFHVEQQVRKFTATREIKFFFIHGHAQSVVLATEVEPLTFWVLEHMLYH